jgi:nitroimidazol reductase NimA-like FMN-containing flavoprotein (pyridoxamine 5'-phosphate oxidase superfamily)
MLEHRGFEVLDEAECRAPLEVNRVGRIGLSIGALPAIFPVTYALDGDSIVFRAATGTQLAACSARGVLAFETGCSDPEGTAGWSVLAVGLATEVADPGGSAVTADRCFRLPIDLISGTRFVTGDGGNRHAA